LPEQRLWAFIVFHVLVFILLALDLGVFHRKAHEVRAREALMWSLVWIALSGLFCGAVALYFGKQQAIDFATAYVVEKSLSVDNIFVFVVIFSTFKVPPMARHRVLYWGVLGAILLRAPMIYLGVELLHHFHPAIYFFGAFLCYTGVKLLFDKEDEDEQESNEHVKESRVVRLIRRVIPTTDGYRESRLFTFENGRRLATPLFTTLVIVEISDVMFAVDSIPAVLAVTDDFFVAYTSNIFAILGLRALFFVVSAGVEKFHYLKPALSFILLFVGVKMILGALPMPMDVGSWHVESLKLSPGLSLLVILGALTIAGVASYLRKEPPAHGAPEAEKKAEAAPEPEKKP
jgi:tellurite resistance protein TerC